MRGLARSTSIRIVAVLMVLALRLCLVASSITIVDAGSCDGALHHFGYSNSAQHLVPKRQLWSHARARPIGTGIAVLTVLRVRVPEAVGALAIFVSRSLLDGSFEILGARAPPL